jgi:hypothetical protein
VTSASFEKKGGRNSAALSPCPSVAPTLPERSDRHAPALAFDPAEYLSFLEDTDWTDSQKLEFIDALWLIIVGFVDMGFHIHPIQQVGESARTLEIDSPSVIDLEGISESMASREAERPDGASVRRSDS